MKEGGDVIAHLNDFNWCISDLIRVNVKYEEDDKAQLLLRSLPDSFKHFRTTFFFGKDTLECDAIISDIISYVKMNNASEREAQGEGFLTKESSERGRTKERSKSAKNSRSKSRKKNVECYNYSKKGYYKRECRKLKAESKKARKTTQVLRLMLHSE
ncbi:hypothetical protein ACOSQ2_027941 [Xanthoceras sorbifolium]